MPTGRHFRIADVFTDRPFAGNQLAIVLDADGLDGAVMQTIAREFNFSETTFVLPATQPGCDWRMRIFTPTAELPIAGHPVIGTSIVLRREGLVGDRFTLELRAGPTPVAFDASGKPWMTFPQATVVGTAQRDAVAAALSLEPEDVRTDLPIEVVSCGNPFLFTPLTSLEALGRATPDPRRWSEAMAGQPLTGIYPFVVTGAGAVRSRMFAPGMGVSEDPATGSAAAPLGAYLARHLGTVAAAIEQGVEMGRPSSLLVDASGPQPRVGGMAVVVASGWLDAAPREDGNP